MAGIILTKSRILSASSRTRICMLDASNSGVSSMCCKRRPGVQIKMFMPAVNRSGQIPIRVSSECADAPPTAMAR